MVATRTGKSTTTHEVSKPASKEQKQTEKNTTAKKPLRHQPVETAETKHDDRREIIERLHNHNCHLNARGIYRILKEADPATKITEKEIESVIKGCKTCSTIKYSVFKNAARGHLRTLQSITPNNVISIDFGQMVRKDAKGFTHFAVVVDIYSGYKYVIPVKNLTSDTAIALVRNHVNYYGTMNLLQVDNAT